MDGTILLPAVGALAGFLGGYFTSMRAKSRLNTEQRHSYEDIINNKNASIRMLRGKLGNMQQLPLDENIDFSDWTQVASSLVGGLPKQWQPFLKPLLPSIINWAQENPDKVQALLEKAKEYVSKRKETPSEYSTEAGL